MEKVLSLIEIQANSYPIKYEFNQEHNLLQVDRILNVPMLYPCHYGYILNTKAQDNDELDILIYCDFPIMPGSLIECKPIGILYMSDEKGIDEKIIAVPHGSVCAKYKSYKDYTDIPEQELEKIKFFFTRYKDLDGNKFSKVEKFGNCQEAIDIIKKYTLK